MAKQDLIRVPPAWADSDIPSSCELPDLVVDRANYPASARALTEVFAKSPFLFEMAGRVVKVREADGEYQADQLDQYSVITEAHSLCRPIQFDPATRLANEITLPNMVAQLLLHAVEDRRLRVLRGFCSSPLLSDDGAIRFPSGYDPETRLWCSGVPLDPIPGHPTREDATAALQAIRNVFASLPFSDTADAPGSGGEGPVGPPSLDESSMLVGLLTAVCRQSLPFAPGLLVRAPHLSGAGTGKGQLVRAIAEVAYGQQPSAFTSGGSRQELRKRVESALLGASSMMFLDNCNAEFIVSSELAQVMTESRMVTRPLGGSRMIPIETNLFVAVTGNGLKISEDLARRFIVVELDAKCENPEQRSFTAEFATTVRAQRKQLLAAVLTVWRWGRQNTLQGGIPLGSFETWARWCRDPLLALGCADPIARSATIKADDPFRAQVAEFLATWFRHHGSKAVRLEELNAEVRAVSGGKSRQSLQSFVGRLNGTRAGGLSLSVRKSSARWTPATYTVTKTDAD